MRRVKVRVISLVAHFIRGFSLTRLFFMIGFVCINVYLVELFINHFGLGSKPNSSEQFIVKHKLHVTKSTHVESSRKSTKQDGNWDIHKIYGKRRKSDSNKMEAEVDNEDNLIERWTQTFRTSPFTDGSLLVSRNWTQTDLKNILFGVDPYKELGVNHTDMTKKYLPNMRNPCWVKPFPRDLSTLYTNNTYFKNTLGLSKIKKKFLTTVMPFETKRYIRCQPYFYILGVTKSGTTDLYRKLINHPDIIKPALKEPHYWNKARLKISRKYTPFQDYVDIFDDVGAEMMNEYNRKSSNISLSLFSFRKITFEASPDYASDPSGLVYLPGNKKQKERKYIMAHTLHAMNPTAKYVFILRNPTTRLYSQYRMWNGTNSTEFHEMAVTSIKHYTDCISHKTIRYCFYCQNLGKYNYFERYMAASMYYVFISDWLKVIPKDKFLFLKAEEYFDGRKSSISKLLDFLGLRYKGASFKMGITSQLAANKAEQKGRPSIEMLPHTKLILDRFYYPFSEKLTQLLGHTKWLWKD